jgi:hypothetical protein
MTSCENSSALTGEYTAVTPPAVTCPKCLVWSIASTPGLTGSAVTQ